MITATKAWLGQLRTVIKEGQPARDTLEIISSQFEWSLTRPMVTVPGRRANHAFAAAEAAYIITGQNRVSYLQKAMRTFGEYASDDGVWQAGSYGPPFVDQVPYIVDVMRRDQSTRQAVTLIWRPRPYASKDIPCTLTLQYLVRDDVLHCVVNMRSSDVWRGLVYDIFCFSCMASVIAHSCGISQLGRGFVHAGSSHVYNRDREAAINLANSPGEFEFGPRLEPVSVDVLAEILISASESETLSYLCDVFYDE